MNLAMKLRKNSRKTKRKMIKEERNQKTIHDPNQSTVLIYYNRFRRDENPAKFQG